MKRKKIKMLDLFSSKCAHLHGDVGLGAGQKKEYLKMKEKKKRINTKSPVLVSVLSNI